MRTWAAHSRQAMVKQWMDAGLTAALSTRYANVVTATDSAAGSGRKPRFRGRGGTSGVDVEPVMHEGGLIALEAPVARLQACLHQLVERKQHEGGVAREQDAHSYERYEAG
jgi:hypothetical protein